MIQPTDPGHQDESLPGGSGPKATQRYSPLKPRASRKPKNNDRPDIALRISNLSPVGKRMMSHYAGNELMARIRVLQKLEDHQRQYNDAPVVKVGTQWTCGICDRGFGTLQKAAIHVGSNEWKLRSWHCLEVGCGRVYGSSNELTRHLNSHRNPSVNASLPQQNITAPPGAAPPTTRQITRPTQRVTQRPSLTTTAAPSTDDMGHVPASTNRPPPFTQHPDIAYNRQFGYIGTPMFIGQDPRVLPGVAYPPAQEWNDFINQNVLYATQANEQPATSWDNSMQYPAPRHLVPFQGPTEPFFDFQAGSTLQQLPIDTINAPRSSRQSDRLHWRSENRTNATSQNRPDAGTPPIGLRHRSGDSTWGYPSGSRQDPPRSPSFE